MIVDVVKEPYSNIKHSCPTTDEKLDRPEGIKAYNFWHFSGSVKLLTPKGIITTKPHICYVSSPHSPQYFWAEDKVLFDWFHFDENNAQDWLNCDLLFDTPYYPNTAGFVTDIIWKMEAEYVNKNSYHEKYIDSLMAQLFIQISRSCKIKNPPTVNQETANRFQEIRMELFANCNHKWSIEELAIQLNVSQSYFFTTYKELFGISPTQDLINIRINNAKNLLLHTDDSVAYIAEQLGYTNPYHFSRQFHDLCGHSPRDFRKFNRTK